MLFDFIAVGIGGFVGAVLRYLCYVVMPETHLPLVTLGINMLGSFVLAVLAAAVVAGFMPPNRWSLCLRMGLCGGFTALSAYSIESMQLIQQGHAGWAVAYSTATCVLCVLAAFAGTFLVAFFAH